ncbi:hypothetical protein GCM10025331_45720 [Actinoplanes utahensis]|nr:hypothetical protein Aut01nite_30410 [Actinoplanes utahensis]
MARMGTGARAAAVMLVIAGIGVGAADTAAPPPPLALVAAGTTVTAERHSGGVVRFDLGLRVVAGREPFEVRARRAGYDKPVLAYRIVDVDGERTRVQLPAGMVTGLRGLDGFTTITFTDGSGRIVAQYRTVFCGNAEVSAPSRRDAAAANPYPIRCGGENPFALGAVWGVPAGWSAAVPDQPGSALKLAAGRYTATATLAPRYRKAFGIPERNATATVAVTVVDAAPPAPVTRPAPAAPPAPSARPPVLDSTPKDGPRPDLRSLPAWHVSASRKDGRWLLSFRATIWNAGTSPLVMDGPYQLLFDSRGRPFGSRPAGDATGLAGHALLDAERNVVARGRAEAFCLAGTDAVDYTIPGARWRPESTCTVLDIGNGATTTRTFDITDLPNGIYHLEVTADPDGRLAELCATDNTALRRIILGGTPTARTVEAAAVHGITG